MAFKVRFLAHGLYVCATLGIYSLLYSMDGRQVVSTRVQSLYEYCGIAHAQHAQRDVKNIIAQKIIGEGGWWYPQPALDHKSAFIGAGFVTSDGKELLTGDDKGIAYCWNLESLENITKEEDNEGQTVNGRAVSRGEMRCFYQSSDKRITGKIFSKLIQITRTNNVIQNSCSSELVQQEARDGYSGFKAENGYKIEKVFLTDNGNDLFVLSNQNYNIVLCTPQRKKVTWFDVATKRKVDEITTEPIMLPYGACTGDLHTSGKAFVLGEGHRFIGISLGEGSFDDSDLYLKDQDALVSVLKFSPDGSFLAVGKANGQLDVYTVNNDFTFTPLYSQNILKDASIDDICFHPSKRQVFVSSGYKPIGLFNLDGQKLRSFNHQSCVDKLVVHPSGNMLIKVGLNAYVPSRQDPSDEYGRFKENAVIVWKKHMQPTLEQVLMRVVLRDYLIACFMRSGDPKMSDLTPDTLVDWMGKQFNLDKIQLAATWDGLPSSLKSSILATVKKHASCISILSKNVSYHE